MDLNIRLKKITLTNFRNIEHAVVDIPGGSISDLLGEKSSVLGIYGQNGSGKSSLLMALNALKTALSGKIFNYPFASCIRYGCEFARLEFEFSACSTSRGKNEYNIFYSFSLKPIESENNYEHNPEEIKEVLKLSGLGNLISEEGANSFSFITYPSVYIYDELLQYSSKLKNKKKTNKQVLIDTSEKACKASGRAFGNKSRYEQLTAKAQPDIHDYFFKIKDEIPFISFIFVETVVKALIESSNNTTHKIILNSLNEYGSKYLFVTSTNGTGQEGWRILPLSIWSKYVDGHISSFIYPLLLFSHCKVLEEDYPYIKDSIPSISDVVEKIVPGLSIEINDYGKTVENDVKFHEFELFSVRKDVRIPLEYESEGTRKIISFIAFLVAAYNNPSVTIAIDEIDSGIFEYTLGVLLSIMNKSAKGQLIFTSHNLHPLDKNFLSYKNLLFTTVTTEGPNEKPFVKLLGTSGNNNLRDRYISLISSNNNGKNKNEDPDIKRLFVFPADTESIEQAFSEAGQSKVLPDIR